MYCLFRLFDEGLPDDIIVQPEGTEDLAVKTSADELLEAVQVKDLTANLTASAFKPSFYERISDLCRNNSTASIRIVSFGPIGPELRKAYDNKEETPSRTLDTKPRNQWGKEPMGPPTFQGLAEAKPIGATRFLRQCRWTLEQLPAEQNVGGPKPVPAVAGRSVRATVTQWSGFGIVVGRMDGRLGVHRHPW